MGSGESPSPTGNLGRNHLPTPMGPRRTRRRRATPPRPLLPRHRRRQRCRGAAGGIAWRRRLSAFRPQPARETRHTAPLLPIIVRRPHRPGGRAPGSAGRRAGRRDRHSGERTTGVPSWRLPPESMRRPSASMRPVPSPRFRPVDAARRRGFVAGLRPPHAPPPGLAFPPLPTNPKAGPRRLVTVAGKSSPPTQGRFLPTRRRR
jgi:hypothetical protein